MAGVEGLVGTVTALVIFEAHAPMSKWQPLSQATSAPLFSADEALGETDGLPKEVTLNICDYLPMEDLLNVALVSKAFYSVVRDEQLWEQRWKRLGWLPIKGLKDPLLDTPIIPKGSAEQESTVATTEQTRAVDLLADLEPEKVPVSQTKMPYMSRMKRAYAILRPFALSLVASSSASSSLLFTRVTDLQEQLKLASVLARFVSPLVGGFVDDAVHSKMRAALSYTDTLLRSAFREEDSKRKAGNDPQALSTMASYANLVWELRDVPFYIGASVPSADAERPRLSALRRAGGSILVEEYLGSLGIFSHALPYDPSQNVPKAGDVLDLKAMHIFIDFLADVVTQEALLIRQVFPTHQHVMYVFLEQVSTELLMDYVSALLERMQSVSDELYLDAFARSLPVALRLVEGQETEAPDIISTIWSNQLNEYLSIEAEWQASTLRALCNQWTDTLERMRRQHRDAELLGAPPSAAQKRSFLSTFKRALLKPVSFSASDRNTTEKTQESEPDAGYVGLKAQGSIFDDENPTPQGPTPVAATSMQMSSLLNLNTAVELINVTRLTLQRLETLRDTRTSISSRVQPVIDAAVVTLFSTLVEYHMKPGFKCARDQIATYRPMEHDADAPMDSRASAQVTPLVLFFDLVHIGDTIQQMMQVFFDEIATRLLSKVDFTNAAVREKKRFENDLDDNVAEGLNAGVALLTDHMEYIVFSRQNPRDFYPEHGRHLDLSRPTQACSECIECLRISCQMLATCTDKNVLDIFYEEIGLRLHACVFANQVCSVSISSDKLSLSAADSR